VGDLLALSRELFDRALRIGPHLLFAHARRL
jgi:hypothetical protein